MARPPNAARSAAESEDAPPFFGSWRRIYIGVLVYLAVIIAVFYAFTQAYR